MSPNHDIGGRSLRRRAGWAPLHETDDWIATRAGPGGESGGRTTGTGRDGRAGTGPGAGADGDAVAHTGTTVVALTTEDATVLAADRRASLGGRFVANKDVEKIHGVHPTAALALSGAVGHIQEFANVLRAAASLYETRRGEPMSLAALSTLAANVLRSAPRLVTPVLGGVDASGPHVYGLDAGGGSMADRYTAAGSGMQLAYGVLEREYEDGMDAETAAGLAARAIDAAGERDTASGDGLTLATATAEGVEFDRYDAPAAVA